MSDNQQTVADAQTGNWIDRFAPAWLKPYARLARWDRPIGIWLLWWPCVWSLGLAAVSNPDRGFSWLSAVLMLLGAILMRGAGCTFNDIVDRDIDDKVARTRSRPIPSGQVSAREALVFMVAQALLATVILFQFNRFTVWACIGSLVLVAIYPFMKRITWWPQAFLGLAFSWGALVGWSSQTGGLDWAPVLLYLGTILWVIGYDTLYALQDIEDDALIGVKSTARLFGQFVRPVVGSMYAAAFILWTTGALLVGAGVVFATLSLAAAAILAWQVWTIDPAGPENPKARFYSNHYVGVVMSLALLAEWVW